MPKVDDYLNARSIAREKLLTKNPDVVCLNAGGAWSSADGGKKIVVNFLNREVGITWPAGEVSYTDNGTEPALQEQILILHYLANASEKPLRGQLITFREIPSGEFYYEPFCKRAQIPMVAAFGTAPEKLWSVGEKLDGRKGNVGDVSMIFPLFPKVPITLVLWRGDEEFPPDGNILFDAGISDLFNAEDVAFLSGAIIYRLIFLAKA